MTALTVHSTTTGNDDGDSYNIGYFEGELDAITHLPRSIALARVSMAGAHNHLWAQGYQDGYLHQTQVTQALELAEHEARTAAKKRHPATRASRIGGAA